MGYSMGTHEKSHRITRNLTGFKWDPIGSHGTFHGIIPWHVSWTVSSNVSRKMMKYFMEHSMWFLWDSMNSYGIPWVPITAHAIIPRWCHGCTYTWLSMVPIWSITWYCSSGRSASIEAPLMGMKWYTVYTASWEPKGGGTTTSGPNHNGERVVIQNPISRTAIVARGRGNVADRFKASSGGARVYTTFVVVARLTQHSDGWSSCGGEKSGLFYASFLRPVSDGSKRLQKTFVRLNWIVHWTLSCLYPSHRCTLSFPWNYFIDSHVCAPMASHGIISWVVMGTQGIPIGITWNVNVPWNISWSQPTSDHGRRIIRVLFGVFMDL